MLQGLSRPNDPNNFGHTCVQTDFAVNDRNVDFANLSALDKLPGEEIVFEAHDVGDKKL